MLLFIPTLIIAIDALLQFLKDKNVFELIKKGFLISILPLISIFAMLPRFLIVWRWHSGSGYTPGYYGLNNFFNVVKDNPVLQRVLPPISQIPNIELILFVLSLILLTFAIFLPYQFYVKNNKNIAGKKVNPKSKTIWLLFTIYYFAFIYLAEVFLYQPYYIGRMRNLQPYIIFPTLAFLLYNIIQGISLLIQLSIKDKGEFIKNSFSLIATLLLIIFLFYGTGMKLQYDQLVHGMQNQHLTIQEYEAYKWFHKNALPDETILFFGGISQNEQLYANRIHAVIDMNEYQRLLNGFAINETITLLNLQGWGGSTTRTNIQRYSRWDYEELPEPSNNVSINEFNYVFFQDLSEQVAQANDYIIYNYVQELGFKLVYDNNGYTIIKNDNK